MAKRFERWTKKQMRKQLEILRGEVAPTICLKNATYLNNVRKKWLQANIWIYEDRIIYVGNDMPLNTDETEVIDCKDYFLVPGYIEHHAHPFQLYNPQSLAHYAAERGTTTLINDNILWFLNSDKKKALTVIEDLDKKTVATMLWWCRYDAQTELLDEEEAFSFSKMKAWIEHPLVVQGGELTAWPKVLGGDDGLLHWMQETKRLGKPIEGHLPGASERTLTQMALLGVSSDHEAMTGEEALLRLNLGYTTSLRHSSIRPDLPKLIEELLELGLDDFSRVMLTTDGSTPSFYENGFMDWLISIAMEKGVPDVEAYAMATYNVAQHYRLDEIGMIAPGKLAHINFLENKNKPTPFAVLSKGKWIKRNGEIIYEKNVFPWNDYGVLPLQLDFQLTLNDMHFSMPLGIEMVNAVILKPYRISTDVTQGEIPRGSDESFFMMIDRNGKWLINTVVKHFAKSVSGFASSYSNTGDIIIIGKNKNDMLLAFQELKEQQGGLVLCEDGKVISRIYLDLFGMMSSKPMDALIEEEKKFVSALKERGYPFEDPIYSLLFFSSTHLPYIRVTQRGIFDVKKKTVLFPSIMR